MQRMNMLKNWRPKQIERKKQTVGTYRDLQVFDGSQEDTKLVHTNRIAVTYVEFLCDTEIIFVFAWSIL
jgi:hypothetical protein